MGMSQVSSVEVLFEEFNDDTDVGINNNEDVVDEEIIEFGDDEGHDGGSSDDVDGIGSGSSDDVGDDISDGNDEFSGNIGIDVHGAVGVGDVWVSGSSGGDDDDVGSEEDAMREADNQCVPPPTC
eukprot:CAMPEP_0172483044 /NCGR_PEP_ID=MMETSP1066-20121228/9842_1 /TAXON_ID=671091 /ORGANISM="Coscinodiscus wailesii, Strain CCMP2513" /LENGTH=124 /DNA_ID=CAMNT_0013246685 /DNA_START=498 /DNA_END=869 /DNA_ORIENTATION=-